MVILRQNWSEVVDMITFCKDIGGQAVNFIPAVLNKKTESMQIGKKDFSELSSKLAEALHLAERLRIETNMNELLSNFSYFTESFAKSKNIQSQIPCYAGWTFSYILEKCNGNALL